MSASETLIKRVWNDVRAVREQAPLIVNITNYVVTNNTANSLLALGASPAMNHVAEDLPGLVDLAGALVVNIGTLADDYVEGMHVAMTQANDMNMPVILDPVAAGVNALRTGISLEFLEKYHPVILRGNASEIMAVAGEDGCPKGVDTSMEVDEARGAAKALNKRYGCVVLVSGETDLVVDASREIRLAGGSAMMPRVTGLGCTCTALAGAFAAVQPDYFQAAVDTAAVMNIAGEQAAEVSPGPGSLQMHLHDALYLLDEDTIRARLKVAAL
ncbi:hydroxyethylthiazole kinase [Pseudodesulfovibrio thermohalotolerans]|uniref:hydroxyethylthiazole kinase n=1 Tax=Pseudodesulfovibrio thermohalotolerans TaxID=2880651 RepID=UPI0024416479|nr:hydroxyethylthiazole kinase [Pseudodesulfovibrio thermohalotolerans]WFS61071.1 hydroxyethylthiazole kinase [Pseudodesulfovibrio thermohalotolerans]